VHLSNDMHYKHTKVKDLIDVLHYGERVLVLVGLLFLICNIENCGHTLHIKYKKTEGFEVLIESSGRDKENVPFSHSISVYAQFLSFFNTFLLGSLD